MPETTETQLTGLAKLRAEVPKHLIGKLPRVTCRDCTQNRGQCGNHKKAKCHECGAWISSSHMHLDYVGHAETTSLLLDADPFWTWEPAALDEDGLPKFDEGRGLWIRLTVCGVTRLGYGTADNASGSKARGDLIKEVIGDAIRNAAMRFGVALDLWAKTDIHADDEGAAEAPKPQHHAPAAAPRETPRDRLVQPRGEDPWAQQPPAAPEPKRPTRPMLTALATLATKKRGIGNNRDARLDLMRSFLAEPRRAQIRSGNDLTFDEASHIIGLLEKEPDLPPPPAPASEPNPRNGNAPVSAAVEAALSLPTLSQLVAAAVPGVGVFEQLKPLIREANTDAAMERLIMTALDAAKAGHLTSGQYDALCEMGRLRSDAMHADEGWSHQGVRETTGATL